MNPRDKSLVVILASVVAGLGLVAFFSYSWFWVPLRAANAAIDQLEQDNAQLLSEWKQFTDGKARLDWAKLKSLPEKPDQATAEYVPYLESTLRDAGLQVAQFTPQAPVKVKPPDSVKEIKEVGHRIIAFTIKATGDEAALVSALDQLQKTPYEHRVKSLTVERADKTYGPAARKTLTIDMVIEVLLVAGNKNLMGLHAGVDPQYYLYNFIAARNGFAPSGWGLWAPTVAFIGAADAERRAFGKDPAARRDYADIPRRNIFVGAIPIIETPPIQKGPKGNAADEEDPPPTQPPEFVPKYMYLTTVVPSQQEAFLFNRIFGGRELKLKAKPGSGYELFKITDEDRNFVFLLGKVLAIGSREMCFQVRNQVYVQHVGESLEKAMQSPLSLDQMDDLGVSDLFDRAWAKEQMDDTKKKADAGKRNKAGKGR